MESKNNDTRPHFVSSDATAFSHEYVSWLKNIKQLYRQSQAKAALKVNEELLRFYWALGRDMVALKIEEQWGKGVMKQLSLDLRAAFPEQKGFSETNLRYVKRWYSYYSASPKISQQPAEIFEMPKNFALVPWFHHVQIFTHCHTVAEALFYIDKVIEGNWSRRMLEDNIQENLYGSVGRIPTNFNKQSPKEQSELVLQTLEDPYKLSFLQPSIGYNETGFKRATLVSYQIIMTLQLVQIIL